MKFAETQIEYKALAVLYPQDYADIAVTAAEGGINYWATILNYDPYGNDVAVNNGTLEDGTPLFQFRERALDSDDTSYHNVTPALIARGIRLFLERGQQFADMDEFAAMDASEADTVIQLGWFGEVVYS